MQTFSILLEGLKNTSRFRDETRSENSPKKLATPEGNGQLGSNCPNSKAPENSFRVWGLHALGFLDNGIGLRDQPWVIRRQNLARLMELECEDRIGTGPPRARTDVIYVDLGY